MLLHHQQRVEGAGLEVRGGSLSVSLVNSGVGGRRGCRS